jgi:hypothetical protein
MWDIRYSSRYGVLSMPSYMNFLFKYLGVPLSLSKKLPRAGLQSLVELTRYLTISPSGKAKAWTATAGSLSISMGLSTWVHKALEKIFKGFL